MLFRIKEHRIYTSGAKHNLYVKKECIFNQILHDPGSNHIKLIFLEPNEELVDSELVTISVKNNDELIDLDKEIVLGSVIVNSMLVHIVLDGYSGKEYE